MMLYNTNRSPLMLLCSFPAIYNEQSVEILQKSALAVYCFWSNKMWVWHIAAEDRSLNMNHTLLLTINTHYFHTQEDDIKTSNVITNLTSCSLQIITGNDPNWNCSFKMQNILLIFKTFYMHRETYHYNAIIFPARVTQIY